MHFDSFNLNLLRVFEAVMAERSVLRAADRLSLSASAVSHALNRLRYALRDELFVRERDGMRPTPLATEIAAGIEDTLRRLRLVLDRPHFDPETSRRTFTIAGSDFSSAILLPRLLSKLAELAPHCDLRILSSTALNLAEELDAGRLDMAVGIFVEIDPRFGALHLFDEEHVFMTSGRYPRRKLTFEDLAKIPHIVVTLSGRDNQVVVDDCVIEKGLRRNVSIGNSAILDSELARRGLTRRIAAVVPHPLAVPVMLGQLDAVAMLPRRLAEHAAEVHDLRIHPDPCGPSVLPMYVIWHERASADSGIAWLRDQFAALAAEMTRRPGRRSAAPAAQAPPVRRSTSMSPR